MKLLLLYDNALASLCIHYWLFVYLSCPSFVPVSIYNFSFCTIIAPFLHSSLFLFRCHLSTLSTFSASSSFHYLSFCFPFRLCSIPFLYSFSLVLQIQNVNFNISIISFVFLTSSQPSNFSLPFLSFSQNTSLKTPVSLTQSPSLFPAHNLDSFSLHSTPLTLTSI